MHSRLHKYATTAVAAFALLAASHTSAENPNAVPASPGGVDRITAAMAADCSPQYLDLVELADSAVASHQWPRAIGLLTEAMRLEPANPQNVMLLQNVGMMHFYSGADSLAIATLSQAHAIAPRSTVILNNRARVLAANGLVAEALADYSEVVDLDPDNADAHLGRVSLYLQTDSIARAIDDIHTLDRLRPDDPEVALPAAIAFTQAGDYPHAIERWTLLLNAQPAAEYYAARALAYLLTDDLTAASDDIARGLELEPDYGELFFCRAYLNRMRYRPDDAAADARRARSLGVDPRRLAALGF